MPLEPCQSRAQFILPWDGVGVVMWSGRERKVWAMSSHGELGVYHYLEKSKGVSPISKLV